MQNNKKRFEKVKGHVGVRYDRVTGKYVARKYMHKKEYCSTFAKLSEAINWRRNFHPLLNDTEINSGPSTKDYTFDHIERIQSRPNGSDRRFTFQDVWMLYKKQYFPLLESQTIEDRLKFAKYFFPELMPLKMHEITSELLDVFMDKKVQEAKSLNNPRRMNFNNDLKCLKAVLNWYRENYDGMYTIPILKRHYAMGIIRKKRMQVAKMTLEQVTLFFNSFVNQFWRDFAEIHFFMAGRCQEVGGLQWESVDFKKGIIRISDVAIWRGDKKFMKLKENTKNGHVRFVHMNIKMKEILKRRFQERSLKKCPFLRESNNKPLNFVFEIEGEPVSYRAIQYHYNKALIRAGLYPQFSSTHILRKAMANLVRKEMGLDAAQAAGGWRSRSVVEKFYSDVPDDLNRKVVNLIGTLVVDSHSDADCHSEHGGTNQKCDLYA